LKIIESEKFKLRLQIIAKRIKEDKPSAALKFAKELKRTIVDLNNSPYKYRKSFYFDDEEIRDMTYKGYTIVYKIDTQNDRLIIADIFNQNKP